MSERGHNAPRLHSVPKLTNELKIPMNLTQPIRSAVNSDHPSPFTNTLIPPSTPFLSRRSDPTNWIDVPPSIAIPLRNPFAKVSVPRPSWTTYSARDAWDFCSFSRLYKVAIQMAVFSGWEKRDFSFELWEQARLWTRGMTLTIASRIRSCVEVY
jgi:hypothetical protein